MPKIVKSSILQSPGLAEPARRAVKTAVPRRRFKQHSLPRPTVSQETRERLYREAEEHPVFEGMVPENVREYIDWKLEQFLSKQPFWYGHTKTADTRHRASQRQYEARRDEGMARAGMDERPRTQNKERVSYGKTSIGQRSSLKVVLQ